MNLRTRRKIRRWWMVGNYFTRATTASEALAQVATRYHVHALSVVHSGDWVEPINRDVLLRAPYTDECLQKMGDPESWWIVEPNEHAGTWGDTHWLCLN